MTSDIELRLKEIDKEFVRVGIIDAPGTILVGLGLYAKFAAKGEAFLPMLNDQSIVSVILAVGALIMVWGAQKMFRLALERSRLQKDREMLDRLSQKGINRVRLD